MKRILLSGFFLAVASMFSLASAGQVQMSGDPVIDAQWGEMGIQLASAENPYGTNAYDPRTAPSTGIFGAFGGQRAAPRQVPTQSRAQLRRAPAPKRSIDPAFLPRLVDYQTGEAAGTIVIDTSARYLYVVLGDGKAQRYGVGVGREGFGWHGRVHVGRKAEWPTWTPPAEMRKRQPYLPVSMEGGPDNPLGARALYLYDGGRDTLFRIHGSNQPWTIGHAVSSGCIRMRNEDVIELYKRTPVGARVVVL